LILIVSNLAIEEAPSLVNLFPAGAASLVTASDFYNSFRAGIAVNEFEKSTILLGDKPLKIEQIKGIITTVPTFLPVEFYYVRSEDREYVCAETNAFFLYFLNEIDCLKCNPPDWAMLVKGNMHRFQWGAIAEDAGIPVMPCNFINGYPKQETPAKIIKCTVLFGEVQNGGLAHSIKQYSKRLSNALDLPYLDCYFNTSEEGEYLLAHINTIPNISATETRLAIANYFIKQVL
jgi:hypothetical protein